MEREQRNHEDEIEKILKDPKKYRKMMLIMQQTLYDLGYHQSARLLQSQSGINYYSSQLLSIKEKLQTNEFQSAIQVVSQLQTKTLSQNGLVQQQKNETNPKINSISLPTTILADIKTMIYETYCMHQIINKNFEQAMVIISENITNQQKKQFLCQALVLGNHHLNEQEFQKKKQAIFKFCLSSWQQIGEKEIQKVIEAYRQHEGQFNKDIKGLLNEQKLQPPMCIWSVELQKDIKQTITHMRLSLEQDSMYLIEEDKDVLNLHLVSLDSKKLDYMSHCINIGYTDGNKRQSILSKRITKSLELKYKGKRQSVQSLALNPNLKNSNVSLAVCSFNVIFILNRDLEVLSRIQSNNKIQKYLHIDFHPISQLLYTCGYFETLNALDSSGQSVQTVYPFPKTRKFIFSNTSHSIGISLVTNKVYKHSLDEQTLIRQIQLDDGVVPMDLCVSNKDTFKKVDRNDRRKDMSFQKDHNLIQYVAVSSLQFIYILDSGNLNILGKTTSPTNPQKLIVEIKFYHNYLISLAKNFTAYTIETDAVNKQSNSMKEENHVEAQNNMAKNVSIMKNKQWVGQGTFIVEDSLMMSGYKQVLIWSTGQNESEMLDESLQQVSREYVMEEVLNLSQGEEAESESSIQSDQMQDENSEQQGLNEDEDDQDIEQM